MATVCRLRALAALQNFARIQHFRSIASRSAAITVAQKNNTTTNKQSYILQRVSEVSAPVRQYGSVPEMTIDSLKDRCILVLKLFDKVDPEKVTLDARFIEDLGLDSLDVVEIVMAFEDEFGIEIPDETAERLKHVKDVVECLADKMDVAQ